MFSDGTKFDGEQQNNIKAEDATIVADSPMTFP
jgi:hypothetical protein